MEPQKVFLEFLSLCTDHAGHIQYYLANNAVLEWFGRTIRGKDKIKSFVRYEISQEYEHQFNNWKMVNPFETRPSHFETKSLSLDAPSETSNNTQIDLIGNTTPTENKIKIVKLPALCRGRKFLPESDSDDEDLKDLGLAKIVDTTPPSSPSRSSFSNLMEGPPLKKVRISKFKNLFTSTEKDIMLDNTHGSYSTIEFDNCNYNSKNEESDNCNYNSINDESGCTRLQSDKIFNPLSSKYSDLYYIEATGRLNTLNRLKYHGEQHMNSETDAESFLLTNLASSSNNSSYSEREVRLKISYRIVLESNRIEFALIIYEHSIRKPSIRRNLLLEFKETAEEIDEKKTISVSKTKSDKKNDNIKVKRKTPLNRLLRLF